MARERVCKCGQGSALRTSCQRSGRGRALLLPARAAPGRAESLGGRRQTLVLAFIPTYRSAIMIVPAQHVARTAESSGQFLPFHLVSDWLDPQDADALLDFALATEDRFTPAQILYDGQRRLDTMIRQSSRLDVPEPFAALLTAHALKLQPLVAEMLGVPPFAPTHVEMELAAHGDGARFDRHIDTLVVGNRRQTPRILTFVLYLFKRPARFSGGALRFYALGGSGVVDVAPQHNAVVAFPAIAPHSVERVSCGPAFADRRFAVTLWLHR